MARRYTSVSHKCSAYVGLTQIIYSPSQNQFRLARTYFGLTHARVCVQKETGSHCRPDRHRPSVWGASEHWRAQCRAVARGAAAPFSGGDPPRGGPPP